METKDEPTFNAEGREPASMEQKNEQVQEPETPEFEPLISEEQPPEEAPLEEESSSEQAFEETPEPEPEHFDFESESDSLAHVDFDLLDTTGRWFLKVLSGPNTGAEFSMQSGTSYLIGTDAASCDVVFQDLSVSRQHARLTIDTQENVAVEDLNSRNGTFVDGDKLTAKKHIESNVLISMGTTTFMLIDREGERQTIVSPVLQPAVERKEEASHAPASAGEEKPERELTGALQEAVMEPLQTEIEKIKEKERKEARISQAISALVVLASITGLLIVVGVGTTFLFKTQEVEQEKVKDPDAIISATLKDFPNIRYSFNPITGKLLLLGHVLTPVERNRVIDSLQNYKFITQIDYSNVVIDEFVWREINQLIAKNPAWRGVTVSAPIPGKFVISGFLKTRKQAESLYDYLSQNFLYLDLLERRVIIEEEVNNQIQQKLLDGGFRNLKIAFVDGDLTITGSVSSGSMPKYENVVASIKEIPGVRAVRSFVSEVAPEQAMVNITDRYRVTGSSLYGKTRNVVINGRILMAGDILDGMTITDIQPNAVFLEKDGIKYRIDF